MPQKKPHTYRVISPGEPHPQGWKVPPVNDLLSSIALIKTLPGQYIETDREIDVDAWLPTELSKTLRWHAKCS